MNELDMKVVYGEYVAKGYKAKELALASHGYIAKDVRDIKTSYIRLGFHLRESQKNLYYEDFGFISLADYADANFGLDKSALSRCMKVFERFSLRQGGVCKMFLDDRYKDYSYSQLCEMVSMDGKQLEKVKPSMTVKEIRELKKVATSQLVDLVPDPGHDKRWFVERWYAGLGLSRGARLVSLCLEGRNRNERAKAVQEWISPEGYSFSSSSEYEFVFLSFAKGCSFRFGSEKMAMKYTELVDEIVTIVARERLQPEQLPIQEAKVAMSQLQESDPDSEPKYQSQPELQEKEPEHKQPDLPLLKNNDQRKDWLRSYKDWGLWYRDDHINVEYYKYDFDNGARLIVEMYHRKASKYRDAHEEYYYHLLRRPDSEYERFPDSETVLLDFLKDLQKKKNK